MVIKERSEVTVGRCLLPFVGVGMPSRSGAAMVIAGVLALAGCTPCSSHHYSTCPTDRCIRVCTPSACGPGGGCTDDCDGPGSCVGPDPEEPSSE